MNDNAELALARTLAVAAGKIQLSSRRALPPIERKADRSPVTQVDRRCERLIREGLLGEFPEDGFMGEESGSVEGSSGRRWIVDPLDGTRPYLRGIPTFSVMIGLEEGDGSIGVGVVHLPALGETYWAARGSGAFCNGEAIRVSSIDRLDTATGSVLGLGEAAPERETPLLKLMRSWEYSYGFMDAYSYMCVAAGRLDACVSVLDRPWDRAAAVCIVTEAGGRFSDIHGADSVHGGSTLMTNGLLHEAIVDHFREYPQP
jgi:histidinol phosphatase-like enzyme (inositol monophosphatase family)